jgi:hypothetical protein
MMKADAKILEKAGKAQRKAEKVRRLEEAETARLEASVVDPVKHGDLVANETFGGRRVKVFKNGYVTVNSTFNRHPPVERLISITDDSNITKKSGLGRGVAAVATGGLNLLSSNKRGDAYLTIVTDTQTHVLHSEAPIAAEMRSLKRLAGAAQRAVSHAPSQPSQQPLPVTVASNLPPAGSSTMSPADHLRQLASLHQDGLLSDAEFNAKREMLLKDL